MIKFDKKEWLPILIVIGVILILVVPLWLYVSSVPNDPSQGEWMNWKFF